MVAGAATAQEPRAPWPWEPGDTWHTALGLRDPAADDATGLLRAAWAELGIGRPERASVFLDRVPRASAAPPPQLDALQAALSSARGQFAAAGAGYAAAGVRAEGKDRGVLLARAGDAYERAGSLGLAAFHYLGAAAELPEIREWLLLRAARVAPSRRAADSLLRTMPAFLAPLVHKARAVTLLRIGDSTAAVDALAAAGEWHEAALVALRRGDTARGRSLVFRALDTREMAVLRASFELVRDGVAPRSVSELLAAGRAAARLGEVRRAVDYASRAVAAGDSSPATLLAWGEWLEQAGRRPDALPVYRLAGVEGAYRHARALLRLGRRAEAIAGFQGFVADHPDHGLAPYALYLAADAARSDSLLLAVARRWPDHEYASRVRLRLSTAALRQGDTARASMLLQREVVVGGRERHLAAYLLARMQLARDERNAGLALLTRLARDDSLGYYGSLARREASLPPPALRLPPPRHPTARSTDGLAKLALLQHAGFHAEVEHYVRELVERSWIDVHEQLDIAEGLIALGRVPDGITLGWRAARTLTLNHPRVLRTIFPWPERQLIEAEAEEFGLDPYLLAGLIRQESSFRADAYSRAGARGFMQLMPATARWVAGRLGVPWNDTLFTVPAANVHVGAAHLAGLLRRYDGALVPSLAAYNAGGTPVSRWLRFPEARDPALFVERIPYVETRGYVRAILRNMALYRALYPAIE